MSLVPVPGLLLPVVAVLVVALMVRAAVDLALDDVPYAVLLVGAGVATSLLRIDVGVRLSPEVLFAVVLPVVLFDGATEVDRDLLYHHALVPLVLVVFGVPLAVLLVGAAASTAFGLSVATALLLATIVVPTDPVAVLALFEELDAPAQLTVVVDGESMLNDGVAVVLFQLLLVAAAGSGISLSAGLLETALVDLLVVGVGGFAIGAAIGSVGTLFARRIRERKAVLLVTIVAAFGSYLVAEVALGVSGILATVGAGLLVEPRAMHVPVETTAGGESEQGTGAPDATAATGPDATGGGTTAAAGGTDASEAAGADDLAAGPLEGHVGAFVRDVWEAGSFLVSTVVYVLLGAQVPVGSVLANAWAVLFVAALVVLVRGVVVYSLVGLTNRVTADPLPLCSQHAIVWGGLHTAIPIALALSLPAWVDQRGFILTVVFGVAVLGAIVQGLLMPTVMRVSGLAERATSVEPADGA